MRKAIFVLGDKGGTGKTTATKVLWERLRHRQDAQAFDADGSTGAFAQVYGAYDAGGTICIPQPRDGVTPVDLHAEDRDGRDQAIQRIIQSKADMVLVDMPATSLTVLERVQADWSMFEVLQDAGFEVVTVNVVTPFKASLGNVLRTLRLAPGANPVVIFNEFFGKRSKFVLWDGRDNKPSKGKSMLAARGGIEVVLPAMPVEISSVVDAADLSFHDAVHGGTLDSMERNYVAQWMKRVEAALGPAAEVLGLVERTAA